MRGSKDQRTTEKDPWVQTACTTSERRNTAQTAPMNAPEPGCLPFAYPVCATQGVMIAPKSVALVQAKAQGLQRRPGALIPGSETLQRKKIQAVAAVICPEIRDMRQGKDRGGYCCMLVNPTEQPRKVKANTRIGAAIPLRHQQGGEAESVYTVSRHMVYSRPRLLETTYDSLQCDRM